MYIVMSDLYSWECWWNNWPVCRWMPTCNVNFMSRWGWNIQVTCLYAALPNRKLSLPTKTVSCVKRLCRDLYMMRLPLSLGGLAGNAGLFSTARDVARVYQMLLNGGEIDGQRYLSKETCQLFTTETSKISRRGLGFDKPDADDPKKGNCAPAAPAEVYGHTGFTGTCAWVDPVNELVYVFLSNRIYPDVTNRKLNQLHIRERIQGAIYDAMKKK